ncbi:TPR repeat region-containing protein [Streptomyces sp. 4N509B]|uniref:TPR repeat region-containing protein n=1 Tax=Streptomyces sp. 4N509B TaxID=3457413 RepID=UPI003FD22797
MSVFRSFTWEDVEARGKKPWTGQRTFAEEIDTESMAGTAAAYARASAEARNVDDLARRATEASEDAGSLNGSSLVRNGRYQETHRALQRGGDDIDAVVTHIIRGMNRALDAEQNNQKHIGWMNRQLAAHQAEAQAKWNGWNAALNHANLHVGRAEDPNVTISYDGRQVTVSRQGLPQWLADEIRESYLRRAVSDAGWADKQIRDEINYYRHHMTAAAGELAELGYNLGEGPFRLFMTPQMARYAATRLKEELRAGTPDPQRVAFYTKGLRSIAESIYGEGVEGDPQRDLTPAERAYLQEFYSNLDAASVGRLGVLGSPDRDQFTGAKQNIANGINMLYNPEINGLTPQLGAHSNVPGWLQDLAYLKDEDLLRAREDPSRFLDAMRNYNGFGELMSNATIASGDAFSESLARNAVQFEKQFPAQMAHISPSGQFENLGGSGLLQAASLNTGVAADLLNEKGFREDLLSLGWDDSRGAAAMVHSGTIIPEGTDPTSAEARKYVTAGYEVLRYAANHNDVILGRDHSAFGGPQGADLGPLQASIGRTGIHYMDMISQSGQTGLWPDTGWTINDTKYHWGFEFSSEERNGLFRLMHDAGGSVRDNFYRDVTMWQAETARDAFRNGPDPSTFKNIGTIAGTVAYTQTIAPDSSTPWTSVAKVVELGGAALTLVPHPAAISTGLAIDKGAGIWNDTVGASAEERAKAEEVRNEWSLRRWRDLPGETAIIDAAVLANYENTGDQRSQRPHLNGGKFTLGYIDGLNENMRKGQLGHFLGSYTEGFDDAAGPASNEDDEATREGGPRE